MYIKLQEGNCLIKDELLNIQDTSKKAAKYKTPKKLNRMPIKFEVYTPNILDKKKLAKTLGVKVDGFSKTALSFFDKIDKEIISIMQSLKVMLEKQDKEIEELLRELSLL